MRKLLATFLSCIMLVGCFVIPASAADDSEPSLPEFQIGDANKDGHVDSMDASSILKYDAGLIDLDEETLNLADANNDGDVNSMDAAKVLKYDAGLLDSLCEHVPEEMELPEGYCSPGTQCSKCGKVLQENSKHLYEVGICLRCGDHTVRDQAYDTLAKAIQEQGTDGVLTFDVAPIISGTTYTKVIFTLEDDSDINIEVITEGKKSYDTVNSTLSVTFSKNNYQYYVENAIRTTANEKNEEYADDFVVTYPHTVIADWGYVLNSDEHEMNITYDLLYIDSAEYYAALGSVSRDELYVFMSFSASEIFRVLRAVVHANENIAAICDMDALGLEGFI